jgi:hypothetical protein
MRVICPSCQEQIEIPRSTGHSERCPECGVFGSHTLACSRRESSERRAKYPETAYLERRQRPADDPNAQMAKTAQAGITAASLGCIIVTLLVGSSILMCLLLYILEKVHSIPK